MAEFLTSQTEDFAGWYNDVVRKADLADYSPVRGCMVIKPYGFRLWELMVAEMDRRIKEAGVENAYFPLFIPESFIKREAQHVEGFAPELAVVTIGGGEALAEPLIVRPTSETIIGEMFKQWIQSYRDLPLLINQWANVVRWEMRPRLFLRTLEFLWQEGHTAHRDAEDCEDFTLKALEIYRSFMHEHLAIPVIVGEKTANERFAGADKTYTCEGVMRNGWALQMGTSHNLGENFAKAFEIKFLDDDGKEKYAWTTSWGTSTRMVGGVVMAHGDEKGLILPPSIAPIQVVIVPIYKTDGERARVGEMACKVMGILNKLNVRSKYDQRDGLTPGFKYNDWEMRGVPLRIEIGPKDVEKESVCLVPRAEGGGGKPQKLFVPLSEAECEILKLLRRTQESIFNNAVAFRNERIKSVDTWDDFVSAIESGFWAFAHWDGTGETELQIKEETKATIRCIPLSRPMQEMYAQDESGICIRTGAPSRRRVLFARAY